MRLALAQRAQVRRHDVRQQRGANGPVRRGKHPANRPGKSMHRAETRIRQRESAEQTGQRHVFARGLVLAVENRFAQRTRGAENSLLAKTVGQWIGAQADVRLDELRQRVETGAWR